MKEKLPLWVYVLMTAAGLGILIAGGIFEKQSMISSAVGAGLFAYGIARLYREGRIRKDPAYAEKLNTQAKDERLIYIADKARSMTLIISIILLAVLSIVLRAAGREGYGFACLYIMCGITFLYFIVYLIIRRKY